MKYAIPYADVPSQFWIGEVCWKRTDENGVEWVRLCKKTHWASGRTTEECCILPAEWLEENGKLV